MTPRTPSYRHHKASGQAVVSIGGKDIYLGRYGSVASRAEYDRIIAEWLANGRQLPGSANSGKVLTISELILAYWKHVEVYYAKDGKPTSEVHAIRSALRLVRKRYGATLASEFTPLAMKAVRDAMIAEGWSRSTI